MIVVALVLFGSTQIPKLARSLGSAQKEFKKGLDEGGSDDGTGHQVGGPGHTSGRVTTRCPPTAARAPPPPPSSRTATAPRAHPS